MTTQFLRRAGIVTTALLWGASLASAQSITPDEPAGYVVFPRIISDASDVFSSGTTTNTLIQLTNTSDSDTTVHCFYINATGVCSSGVNNPGSPSAECRDASDCDGAGATCDPQWTVGDFTITLSPEQPTGWVVDTGIAISTPGSGAVPPVTSDYFVGELKCVQVNDDVSATPVNRNDLIAVATVYETDGGSVDVSSYNALGVQAVSDDGSTQSDSTMCLGGTGNGGDACENADYASCASRLVLSHFFEGASIGGGNGPVSTTVSLVPCTQDITNRDPAEVVTQVLVFNEFEQRMSAAFEIECVENVALSDIGNIFDVSVQGTIAGQTHLRPVGGVGLIGVATEDIGGVASTYHLQQVGDGGVDVVDYVFPLN